MKLTYETTQNGYKIFRDGVVWIVQDGYIPYKKDTMAESAQAHIDEIIKANKANEKAIVEEKQIRARVDNLENMLANVLTENFKEKGIVE